MLISGIKSRPVYAERLALDPTGRHHLVAGLGASAVAALSASLAEATAPVSLLLAEVSGAVPPVLSDRAVTLHDDAAALLADLGARLERAHMGLRLYAVGPEAFLWDVDRVAQPFGFGKGEVVKFPAGSIARRVYCCHCKTIGAGATANLHRCAGCGAVLLVRDHFSRRLGAFMAVRADAEAPGELPEREELFP